MLGDKESIRFTEFESEYTRADASEKIYQKLKRGSMMVEQTNENRINVLLVDDRPENLVALEALLSSKQLNLIKCDSGEAALKYLMKEECALILLDVQMPGIDGYETAKLIKARERNKNTPIIFVTAINQDPEHVYAGYSIGAIDYIFKPFDPDVLKSKVEGFIEMYMNGKKLQQQTNLLNMKTKELEQANGQLLRLASELQRAEAMSKVIGETSMDTMITFDENGRIMTVNPAVKKMFGWTQEELRDTPVDKLFRYSLIELYRSHKETENEEEWTCWKRKQSQEAARCFRRKCKFMRLV